MMQKLLNILVTFKSGLLHMIFMIHKTNKVTAKLDTKSWMFLLPFYIFSRSFYHFVFSEPLCGYLYCWNYRSNVGVFHTDCAFHKFKITPKRQDM